MKIKLAVCLAGMAVIFIATFTALGMLNSMASQYQECREHLFSQEAQCNLADLGQTILSGVVFIAVLALVAATAAYITLGFLGGKKPQYYGSSYDSF